MTDKELRKKAEEYRESITQRLFNEDDVESAWQDGAEFGLKAGRPKWHDLRKDPNDSPDNHRYVWTNVGAGYHDADGWWDDCGKLRGVIAWCEPKFEEK